MPCNVMDILGLKFDAQRYEQDSDGDDEGKEHKGGPSSKQKKNKGLDLSSNLASPTNKLSPTNKFHKDASKQEKKTPYDIPTLLPPKEFTAKERAIAAAIAAEGGPDTMPPMKELPLLEMHHPNALAAINGAAMTKKSASNTPDVPSALARTLSRYRVWTRIYSTHPTLHPLTRILALFLIHLFSHTYPTSPPPPHTLTPIAPIMSRFNSRPASPRQGILVGTFFNGQEKEKMEEVAHYVFERNKVVVQSSYQFIPERIVFSPSVFFSSVFFSYIFVSYISSVIVSLHMSPLHMHI